MSGRGALHGQVAIVTGAGRGIGHAVAMALAREEATVVLAARTRQQLAATAAAIREGGGTALAIPTDVTQDAAVEALVEQAVGELGRVDVLVTAAGA
ncbi:MAG: SDR family NAD(P)-dependent oxidoreductase, partial [Candidatus Rokuibacteriota bacterium]